MNTQIMVVDEQASNQDGYASSRFNATRHGILSKFAVLPWEDPEEYRALLVALIEEHQPNGPTEHHLVEEIAGAIWRKRRLRLAEAAAYKRGLNSTTASYSSTGEAALVLVGRVRKEVDVSEALVSDPGRVREELKELREDEQMTRSAIGMLRSNQPDAYEQAWAALHCSTRAGWDDQLRWEPDDYEDGDEPYRPTAQDLLRWLEENLDLWYAQRRRQLEHMPVVREQAIGEAHESTRLENLSRYEIFLDRKLERTLSTLLRLQDLRRDRQPEDDG